MVRKEWVDANRWGLQLESKYFENLPERLENLYNSSAFGRLGDEYSRTIGGEVVFSLNEAKMLLEEYGAHTVKDFTPFSYSDPKLESSFYPSIDDAAIKRIAANKEGEILFYNRGPRFWRPPATKEGLKQAFAKLDEDLNLSKDLANSPDNSEERYLGSKLLYSTLSWILHYGLIPLYLCHEHENPTDRSLKKSINFAEKIGKIFAHGVYGELYSCTMEDIDFKNIDSFPREEGEWSEFAEIPGFIERHDTWYRPSEGQNVWENIIHAMQTIKALEKKEIDVDTIIGIYWGGISPAVAAYGLFHVMVEMDKCSLNQPDELSYISYSSESNRWRKKEKNEESPYESLEARKDDVLDRFIRNILSKAVGEDILLIDDVYGSGKTMNVVKTYLTELISDESIMVPTTVEVSMYDSKYDLAELYPSPTFKHGRVKRRKKTTAQQKSRKTADEILPLLTH